MPNGEVANLTLPEISGGAPLEATHLGEAPALEFPLYLADPDLLPIISPRGSQHAGYQRTCPVTELTVVMFPEALFQEADCDHETLEYTTAGGWKLGGVALAGRKR